MTRWMTLSAAALFVAAVSTQAQDATNAPACNKPAIIEKKADHQPRMAAEPVSVTGKLSKELKTRKGRDGVEKTMTIYVATTADGVKVMLPPSKNVTAEVLDGMVDKDVQVTGTGRTMEREGKKFIRLMTLTSVEAAPAAAPAAAPVAAPVAAPAAAK